MSTEKIVAYFVRHGTTELNEQNRFRGPTDVPLDDKGQEDAEKLRDHFSNVQLGDAYTSDKQRAVSTGQTILDPKGLVANQTSDLHAWNVGYLAGDEKDKDENKASIDYHTAQPDKVIPGGESLNQFRKRVRTPILNSIRKGHESGVPSITIAHSSVIHELGNLVNGDHTSTLVEPGGVVAVSHDGKKYSAKPILNPSNTKNSYGS
jgi:broad specificity phosphatase PhoE